MRFATDVSAFGISGSGGGFEDDAVDAVEAAVLLPVRPTEALVAPPLLSHGFGGDGEAISPLCVPTHRAVMRGGFFFSRYLKG